MGGRELTLVAMAAAAAAADGQRRPVVMEESRRVRLILYCLMWHVWKRAHT